MRGPRRGTSGFTLIELMIVVSVIAVLSAIALPKFAELIRKSGEGACKGSLGAIRSALSIYYGDMEGQYPENLMALTLQFKHISSIPVAKTPNYHPDSAVVRSLDGSVADSSGAGWAYDNSPNSNVGIVVVHCTHTDTKGAVWTTY